MTALLSKPTLQPDLSEMAGDTTDGSHSTRRLRIAFVHDGLYPHFKGGAERRFYETARRLAGRHDVTYITWKYWDGPLESREEGIRLLGVGEARPFYGEDGKRTIGEAIAFAGKVAPVLARERFDVVDCCATPLLAVYLSWLTSRWRREPLVVTWHEFWGDYWRHYLDRRPLVARIAKAIEAGCVARADSIVAVSEFTAVKLRQRSLAAPVRVVENGVSLADIDRAPPAAAAPDVLFAGRLIDDKRVDLLINAMAQVASRQPSISCAVIGEGPERAKLESLVASLELAEQVEFRGFLSEGELYGTMKGAKVFVLPSVREGFGLSVIEAQAAGAVPIVMRAPYNAAVSLVRDGLDGLICEPRPDSIAVAILRLLEDEATRASMVENAREAARMRDWAHVTSRMERIYSDIADKKRRRAA